MTIFFIAHRIGYFPIKSTIAMLDDVPVRKPNWQTDEYLNSIIKQFLEIVEVAK